MARILVIENEPTIRDLVCSIAARVGHECVSASDGAEAIETFRANDSGIDLVITECHLPKLGGTEAAARIRAMKPDVPVIYTATHPDESLPEKAALIEKPFRAQQLRAVIDRTLRP